MNILLVGAGAVGQVYGLYLQRGGANVTFWVKEKYVAEARSGYTVYPLNRKKATRWEPVRFDGFGVISSADEIEPGAYDAVILCVSSTQLRAPWLDELAGRLGSSTLVMLQPGLDDRSYVSERIDEGQIVGGVITVVSYQTPLPGESTDPPGVAFWYPPLAAAPFSGPAERVEPLLETFRRGHMPVKRIDDVTAMAGFPNAILTPHLVALEAAGWTFAELRRSGALKLASRAVTEAMKIVARQKGVSRPVARVAVRPSTMSTLLRLAKWVIPFDFEVYLEYHFTKVGDQTRFFMSRYIELGREYGIGVASLVELQNSLDAATAPKELAPAS
ncbi:MAG: ketopantoate reductase [Myxococcales bacterium]|nr:ketopantoate reductase [Myxococcales bacterium]